jgi:hypothetical protein
MGEEEGVIEMMKRVDDKIIAKTDNVVAVDAGIQGPAHPVAAELLGADKRVTQAIEKMTYAPILLSDAVNEPLEVTANITSEDLTSIKDKAYVAQLKDFNRWFVATQLGAGALTGPKKAYVQSIYPEFFEVQAEAIDKLNETRARYEKLQIDGCQTLEEIYFCFVFERDFMHEPGSVGALATLPPNANAGQGPLLGIETKQLMGARLPTSTFERGLFSYSKELRKMVDLTNFVTHDGRTGYAARADFAGGLEGAGSPGQQQERMRRAANVSASYFRPAINTVDNRNVPLVTSTRQEAEALDTALKTRQHTDIAINRPGLMGYNLYH